MRRFVIYLLSFFIPVIVFLIVIWAQPATDEEKWSRLNGNCSKASCLYNILTSHTNIDVAFIGSSRTMAAIYDSALSNAWNVRVANLGYCRPGRNLQYEVLKLLFKKHRPKTVFIELWTEEEWYGHYDYGNVASTKDVFYSISSKNPHFLDDLHKNFNMKFDLFQRKLLHKNNQTDTLCLSGYWPAGPKQEDIFPADKADTNSVSQRFTSIFYLEKMIALCKENNANIVFNYLPTFGLSGTEPHYKNYYTAQGQVLIDPVEFLDKTYWTDNFHLSKEGRDLYTEFLITSFSAEQF